MSTSNKWIIAVGVVAVLAFSFFLFKGENTAPCGDYMPCFGNKVNGEVSNNVATSTVAAATSTIVTGIKSTSTQKKMNQYTIKTNMGDIVIELASDKPKTVENFKTLADKGFYNGVRFHRVIKDFMIQTGDPQSKDKTLMDKWGMGGPGYKFADELTGAEQYTYGTVAMANSGPNTNGSQFFIVSANPSVGLQPNYTVFGKVISGMDTVEKIQNVATGQNDRPIEDVMVNSISK